MTEDDSLYDVITIFAKSKIREIAVINANKEFVSIITQFRLIQWLSNRSSTEMDEFAKMTVEQFQLGYKKVYCMHQTRRVIDVFTQMNFLGLSGMAIIDNESKVIGNISVSDLMDIGSNTENFKILWTNAENFMNKRQFTTNIPKLVCVTPHATIKEVIEQLHTYKIHRVYVIKQDTEFPIGVISCTDLLAFFGNALLDYTSAAKKTPVKT